MSYNKLLPNGASEDGSIEEYKDGVRIDDGSMMFRHQKKRWSLSTITSILSTCMTALLCLLLIANLGAYYNSATTMTSGRTKPATGGRKLLPHEHHETVEKSYGRDRSYMSLDPSTDAVWDVYLPPEYTMVSFGKDNEEGYEYGQASISMFHQLHCLASFRKALKESHEGYDIGLDFHDDIHWPHCLDYMRSMIFCQADGTLERPAWINGTNTHTIDGADTLRTCNSPEPLYSLKSRYSVEAGKAKHKHGHAHTKSTVKSKGKKVHEDHKN